MSEPCAIHSFGGSRGIQCVCSLVRPSRCCNPSRLRNSVLEFRTASNLWIAQGSITKGLMAGTSKPALGFNHCSIQCCGPDMPSARFMKATADAMVKCATLCPSAYHFFPSDFSGSLTAVSGTMFPPSHMAGVKSSVRGLPHTIVWGAAKSSHSIYGRNHWV